YLGFFISNLLHLIYEKILLLRTTKNRGYYHFFKVFHIRNVKEETFFGWDRVMTLCQEVGFDPVPVLFDGVFQSISAIEEWMTQEAPNSSKLGGADREGFVIRVAEAIPIGRFQEMTAKWVRADHVQSDEHWTRNWRWAEMKKP
ncbi:RNA ligase family protein, partial [Terasakiella sp. A23]|uniref:RNA ligase family protein n=1 Tax=Terasakiella sp. FCG-A23 TaxID=3080561 RepID=UPI0029548685